jgi:hypothetical protein
MQQQILWVHRNSMRAVHRYGVTGLKPLKTEFLLSNIYINSVRTSQETHYISAIKPNRLILFKETVAVYSENHMENTNTLCA